MIELIHGDCLDKLKELEDNSVDSIVTDPPYGISFMGKKWDYDVPSGDIWRECLRVLKPGGHLLAFAGTRTQHRMAVRIEDAGFEIRDMIAWVYGVGFPKSLNIGKAVDKLQGNEREDLGIDEARAKRLVNQMEHSNPTGTWQAGKRTINITKGTSPWEGWGTALKPALEPITVARKPLGEKTVAQNVLTHGTGGLNIDQCRVGTEQIEQGREGRQIADSTSYHNGLKPTEQSFAIGRFPANLLHDGSDEVVELFPSGKGANGTKEGHYNASNPINFGGGYVAKQERDKGSAARFFYCAKSSRKDRNEGLPEGKTSTHPTVKPTDLMRYLCRLVTPPGGIVLDPFMGSGSTGKAAVKEGFSFIGIEREAEYIEIAKARINSCTK